MSSPYNTPTIFKASLNQRLREEGTRTRRTARHATQVLLMDRFLARVFEVLGDRAVLRGSRAVDLRIRDDRTLRDVDLMVASDDEAAIHEALSAAGRLDLGEWLQYDVAYDTNAPTLLSEGFRVPGWRYRVSPRLVGMAFGEPFGLTMSPMEPMVGAPEILPGSGVLRFAGVAPAPMRLLPLPSQIADSLHYYTLPQPTTNHPRVWDLPEIALLATVGPLEAEDLSGAISRTFVHRGTHNVPTVLSLPPAAWTTHLERMLRAERLPWDSLDELCRVAGAFLAPVLAGGKGRWDPATWRWVV